jgi:hypothetical protein
MSKYDPLRTFLSSRSEIEVPANFRTIEAIIGSRLPPSAFKHRAWWSNNAENHVNARAWLAAGFETDQVDMGAQTLVFRRLRADAPPSGALEGVGLAGGALERVQRVLRGTVRFAPGFDPTEPTGERWDAQES